MKKTLLLTIASLSLIGCGGGSSTVDYLPFRAAENDNWGMISPSGEILFAGEFVNEPSVVIGGIFRVPNADGKFELFKAGDKPTQVGTTSYLQVGMFTENVTPAVLPNEPVALIDKSGKEVAKIDKLNGKTVESVSSFADGYAIYKTSEPKMGMIDTKGQVFIDATYDFLVPYKNGMALGLINNDNGGEVYLIDKSGNGTLLKDTKGMELKSYSEGIALFKSDDNFIGYDAKGEKVLKLDSKIKNVGQFVNGYAFFSDGDAWGLIDIKGETVIRAKYKSGNSINKNFVAFLNNDNKVVFCDFDGTEIVTTDFSITSPFYNGKNAFALESKHWIVIDGEGKEVVPTTFYAIGNNGMDELTYFNSDYINLTEIVSSALGNITANGMAGYEFGASAEAIVSKTMPNIDINNLKSGNDWKIENGNNGISSEINVSSKISCNLGLYFNNKPFSAITERVGGGWYSYNKTVGYKVNDAATLYRIIVNLNVSSRHTNKVEDIVKTAVDYVKATGLFNEPVMGGEDGITYVFVDKNNDQIQLSISYYEDNISIFFTKS